MTIPQAAIDAAADAVHEAADGQGLPEHPIDFATAALEAAMPHLRKQVAEELRAAKPELTSHRTGKTFHSYLEYAALIVEGGTEK